MTDSPPSAAAYHRRLRTGLASLCCVVALGCSTGPAKHVVSGIVSLDGKPLSAEVRDFRLGLEVSVIQAFADRIVRWLKVRDPLSERVHLNPVELLAYSFGGMTGEMTRRAMGRRPVSKPAAGA